MLKFISNKFTTDLMSLLTQASICITPNGYKEGKLYSVIPSDGSGDMSVVRATTATRVNSAGLVELVPYNLLQYSQDFSNAYWFPEPGNSVTSNTTAAPDGTTTADTFTATSGNGMNIHNFNSFNLSDGTFTYSIYLKNNGTNLIEAYLFKIGSGFAARGEINFSAETFTASIGTGTIANVGNGWYRVTLTNTYTSGSFTTGTFTTSTTGTRSVFAWGAQLVEGSTAKDYQKTETRLNIPRLDYSNGTCPSLLVEPQRTNLALYSSSFDDAAWDKGGVTVVANNVTSPDGTQNADKISEDSSNGNHLFYNITPPSTTTATASVFYKKGTRQFFSIKIQIGANSYTQVFDAENSTATSNSSNGLTSVSNTITDFGNGWVRATLSGTNPAGAGDTYVIYSLSNSATPTFDSGNKNPTYQGSTSEYGYFWGAQVEAGAYPTSYIPTTSASVTRNADVISKTGISSLIGQTEGTLFCDINYNGAANTGIFNRIINISDVSTDNTILVSKNDTTDELYVYSQTSAGVQVNSLPIIGTNITGTHKIALAYKANDFVLYFDGVQVFSDTSAAVAACSILNIGTFSSNDQFGGSYNAAALWKTRLTNDQLEALTGTGFNTYAEMASYYNYVLQ
jgi:hypothetical protein